jgi:DNA-nicking Smr family endonuclease
VEVVTGKGNRSDNGKSRLRPAVTNWLEQKQYRYSEINAGALRIYLKRGKQQ